MCLQALETFPQQSSVAAARVLGGEERERIKAGERGTEVKAKAKQEESGGGKKEEGRRVWNGV